MGAEVDVPCQAAAILGLEERHLAEEPRRRRHARDGERADDEGRSDEPAAQPGREEEQGLVRRVHDGVDDGREEPDPPADRERDEPGRGFALMMADTWNARTEDWTWVEGTALAEPLGVEGCYLRAAPGEVLIQTEFPDHPLLTGLLAEGYEGFARTALTERRQSAWPPFSRLAALRDSARDAEAALQFLSDARTLAGTDHRVRLLGPVAAAMARRAGRHHAQLLIESRERAALHRFLESWLAQIGALPSARRVRWAVDVDPMELF